MDDRIPPLLIPFGQNAAEAQNQKTIQRVQELEAIVAARPEAGPATETPTGEASTEALKALQAEYDEYKETQTEKFNTSVSRVNAANVSHSAGSLDRANIVLSFAEKTPARLSGTQDS